jgi:hypothetical protein
VHEGILNFARRAIYPSLVKGKDVLEVGALDVNGSVRPLVEAMEPKSYIGADMRAGKGVDLICKAENLPTCSADVVLCFETLEHCKDWRASALGLALACRKLSFLAISTPAPGFPYHGYPHDYNRFTVENLNVIFEALGFEVLLSESTPAGSSGACSCASGIRMGRPNVAALAAIEVAGVRG